jgi:chromosome segregation ATPase
MAAIEAELGQIELHIEEGTLAEVQHQIQEQIAAHMAEIRAVHFDMEAFHEQMEAIHRQMEPLHDQLADLYRDARPDAEVMRRMHEAMEPFQEQMEQFHRQMRPFHEHMEQLEQRLHNAVRGDIETVLRERLGSVTSPSAPLGEAAAHISGEADLSVRSGTVEVRVSASEARTMLTDLLAPHRVGSQESFDAAVADAAEALSPLLLTLE